MLHTNISMQDIRPADPTSKNRGHVVLTMQTRGGAAVAAGGVSLLQ